MKPIWKGSIEFGLVNIPITLYSAIEKEVLDFDILHKTCHTPLQYIRWCKKCKKAVSWEDTVKGIKQPDGKYKIFTQEELQNLKPSTTDTIDIVQFVDASLINPIYIKNHYYIGPQAKGAKPFALFKKALEKTDKVAIGTFVMRSKKYLCSINIFDNTLLLNTLNYAYEIRDIKKVPALKKIPKISNQELTLATKLINSFTKKTFDISKFKDTFIEDLKKELKTKKTKKPVKQKKVTRPKEKELTQILKASIKPKPRTRRPAAYAKGKK